MFLLLTVLKLFWVLVRGYLLNFHMTYTNCSLWNIKAQINFSIKKPRDVLRGTRTSLDLVLLLDTASIDGTSCENRQRRSGNELGG